MFSPIGLDIGRQYIKAAQLTREGGKGGPARLETALSLPRSGSGDTLNDLEIRQLAQALRNKPFHGRSLVVAVPTDKLLTSILELPPRSSGAPLERLARMEMGRRHGVEADAMEMACWDLPSPARAANRTCVMAVACLRREADLLVDALEHEGFSVRAIDVHALAVSRACWPLLAGAGHTGAILDVGWASSRLVLLYKGIVVYERNLPKCGLYSLTGGKGSHGDATPLPPALAAHEKVAPDLEAMAAEINIPLSYLASQYPDWATGGAGKTESGPGGTQLVLVGGGAKIPGLAPYLARKLEIQVQCPSLSELCSCGDAINALGPSMAFAVGLARYSEDE